MFNGVGDAWMHCLKTILLSKLLRPVLIPNGEPNL